jgi:colanic acid/amylovoran biosynthesis glycosyltransferase
VEISLSQNPWPRIQGNRPPLFVIVPSVPVAKDGKNFIIDEKALSGLLLYLRFWPGSVRCVFRAGSRSDLPYGRPYDPRDLPFEIVVLRRGEAVGDEIISDASVVLASGDNWLDFPIADQGRRLSIPVCFVIEYILETRLQILNLSEATLISKAKSLIWTLIMERKRRRAFSRSSGLQSNGTPAANAYSGLASDVLTFFDTRLSEQQMATDQELASKHRRLLEGGPLRMAFTGRLEKMKGADDLIKIAVALDRAGIDFRLDIYGAGSLERAMKATLGRSAGKSLGEKVRVHDPIDFDRELVPLVRSEVDLFLCCHRQSDPSCTYLETLGCGVPIIAYDNKAWSGITSLADVGWTTKMNAVDEVVRKIMDLNLDRTELVKKMHSARDFAKNHGVELEFERRVGQLVRMAKGLGNSQKPASH